ncbi:MAG: LTA synthase family protein [Lachnospiraceae bacterium]|jgi:hypothetical protein|nr:LTA synthase family protein [Lachnospiraceae bacterium]
MFDADKELNGIIVKYGIDRQNRRFREYVLALELLGQLVSEHEDILFVASAQESADLLRQDTDGQCDYVVVNVCNEESFAAIDASRTVVIYSYYFKADISVVLNLRGIKHICLYDYFLSQGLPLDHDYNDIFGEAHIGQIGDKKYDFYTHCPYLSLIYDKNKLNGLTGRLRQIYLERRLFALFYIRDFLSARESINEYMAEHFDDAIDCEGAWVEIESLLGRVKENIAKRGHRDIIVFWVDALNYGDDEYMPFLKSVSEQALVFENAYTITPFTHPTLRAMLTQRKVIEDRSFEMVAIDEGNSQTLATLQAAGYDFLYHGHIIGYFPERLKSKHYTGRMMHPASMRYWRALCDMSQSAKPQFYILHEIAETHNPFLRPEVANYHFIGLYDTPIKSVDVCKSIMYFDRQLKFYSSFLPDSSVKIYMSDHGKIGNNLLDSFHIILKVQGAGIVPRAEKGLFSYLDFGKLIDWIMSPDDAKYNGLFRDKLDIQDLDWYNKPTLIKRLQSKRFIGRLIGYQGTVTAEEIYIRHNDGSELFKKQRNDGILITQERLDYLRSITSTERIDIETAERCSASKYIYMVLEKYHQRNHEYEERKTVALKRLFADFAATETVALYPGGVAAHRLLLRVGLELCAKVRYIIDRNPECLAGKLGIEVIGPERLSGYDIDTVVRLPHPSVPESVFLGKEDIKTMLKGARAQVLDIYEYLADNGVACTIDFWDRELSDEDIDVGIA